MKRIAIVFILLASYALCLNSQYNYPISNIFSPQKIYPSAKPGESAYDYGYRMAVESKQRALNEKKNRYDAIMKKAVIATKADKIRVKREKEWEFKQLYKIQHITLFKNTGVLNSQMGINDEGISLMLYYDEPAALFYIDKNGNQIDNVPTLLYLVEEGPYASKYILENKNYDIEYAIITPDNKQVAIMSENEYMSYQTLYNISKESREGIDGNQQQGRSAGSSLGIGIGTSTTSNSSSSRQCTVCGGSGVCKSCHGSGGYWAEIGGYVGTYEKKWCDCPSCHGNRKCYLCYGSGFLR